MGMIVAIRAQWPQLEVHRGAGVLKLESEVGGIASVSHPYALHRRLQGRPQQPVISPRVRLRDGTAGKATQGVGDQPLALEGVAGGGKISSGKSHGRIPGCSSSMRSQLLT